MKQSTFSAQVANNLLTVLQGYTKGIRLIALLTMLCTVGVGQMWAETVTYTIATATSVNTSGTAPQGSSAAFKNTYTNNKQQLTKGNSMTLTLTKLGGINISNLTLSMKSNASAGAGKLSYSIDGGSTYTYLVGSANSTVNFNNASWNSNYTSSFTNISKDVTLTNVTQLIIKIEATTNSLYCESFKITYTATAAPSNTVTATSNNNNYGTVSVSGTTITASPKTGYTYADPAYTVTSGTATVSQSGDIFTVTPTSNCTIRINFVEKPKYTVKWYVNGEEYETTQVTEGSKPTFPATPSSCDATSNTFYGWATAVWDGKINDVSAQTIYTSANDMPAEAATYHAVFCEGGGGSVLINETFDDKSSTDSNTEIGDTFSNFNGTSSKAFKSQYGGIKFGNSSTAGYITSKSLDLSTAFTVTLDACKYGSDAGDIVVTVGSQSKTIANNTLGAAGTFNTYTLEFDAATATSTVKIGTSSKRAYIDNVIIATGGGASNFITTCAGSTPAPTKLGTPTNLNVAVTTTTATLSWDVVTNANGYIVTVGSTNYEVNTNSITIDNLTSGTTYTWSVTAKGNGSTYADSDAANGSDFTTKTTTYTITISNDIQNGTIVADKSSAAEGETVKLTVTPEAGYKLEAITVTKATGGIVEVENKTFTMPASNVTVSATFTEIQKYTVSFNTGTNNVPQADITETVGGAGITLPDGPTPNCSGEGWEFFAWSTTNVTEQTTIAPSSLLYATHTYAPKTNTTLHAVYSKTENDGNGGETETVTLTNDEIAGQYVGNGDNPTTSYGNYSITSASGEWGGLIVIGSQEDTKYIQISSDNTNRHLASPTFSNNITNITIKGRHNATKTRNIYICSSNETAKPTSGDLGVGSIATSGVSNQYTDWTDVSIQISGNHTKFYVYADGGLQIHSIVVTTGGSTTTTYYHSNPCDDSEPITPTWGEVTINHSSIQVVCGSKTQLNAADPNGPATISFNGTDLVNPVTVTASSGFFVSTNKTEENTYQSEITINPHKEGQNIGKLQNVYVIAQAPAQSGDFTGTITLTGADITGGSQVINVTADVTCTTYTITWSVSGDKTQKTTFYAGDEWDLPENPDFDCNGREFVGWTTSEIIGETPNAPTDLYKSKGDFPEINEDKTFYAVFATSSGDDSNETTVSVSIKDYAETNSWTNATQYNTINISSHITATAKGNANTGKYYENGADWRLYQTESPTLTFNAQDGGNILSITITYTIDKTGILTFNGSNIASGTPCEINATSAIFGVGNTGGATNGQVRITDISVTYSGGGGGHSGYTTNCDPCINSNFTISESNFTISKDSTLNLGALIQTENQSTIIYTCNTPNGTITADGLFSATESGTYTVTINQDSDDQDHCAVNKTITIKVVGEIVTLKWSVNGATNTYLSPGTVEKNTPIGTLPVPKTGCDDKQFMGWTTTSTVNNDGSDIEYIKATTTPTENTTYYAVFAKDGNQNSEDLEEIFNESFDNINGQGGNDEQWNSTDNNKVGAGTNAIDSLIANHSWSITKGYEANQCVKMGSSKEKGIITTPAINQLNGDAVLTFKAGAWDNQDEKLDIIIEVSEGATISPSAFTLTKGVFNTYTANITGGTNETKITIQAKDASKNRFFIDDIRIAAGTISFEDYTTRCGTYTVTYHGFGGYSTICGDNPAEKVVEVGSTFTVATCTPEDPKGLGRIFAGEWYTNPNGKGDTYKPGDTFVVEEDVVLYAQWALNTSENTTLPTDVEDLATTDVVVTGGTTLTLQAGTTTINSLTLKGGLQENGTYAMPVVNIPTGATLVRNNNKINLDLKVNNNSYYPFAVPFEVANTAANVNYINPTLKDYANKNDGYGKYYRILEYNGAGRADNGVHEDNWVHVGRTDVKLIPGKGYAISAVPASGQDTVTIRITMNVDNAWLANGEQESITVKEQTTTRNQIAVTAHTGAAADKDLCNAGWNFVANPYLTNFTTNEHITGVEYIGGEIIVSNGQFVKEDTDVPYVTIPNANMSWYEQRRVENAILSPMYSFFVQIGTGGTMTFTTAGRQQAPAALRASSEHANPSFEADIVILNSQEQEADHTGLVINDRWTPTYEIGGDLEKMFGTANRTAIYTLSGNTRLAYNALSYNDALVAIPVGFRAQEEGEYTIQLRNAEDIEDVECIELKDLYNNQTTNLLYTDYTFYTDATQEDSRFVVYIVPQKNTPTDISTITNGNTENGKIIFNNHLYIIHNGSVYNGNGQIVK